MLRIRYAPPTPPGGRPRVRVLACLAGLACAALGVAQAPPAALPPGWLTVPPPALVQPPPAVPWPAVLPAQAEGEKPAEKPPPRPKGPVPEAPPVEFPPPPPDPLGPGRELLSGLSCAPAPAPRPSKEAKALFDQFIERRIDPSNTLDLTIGRTAILLLKQTPRLVQIPDERVLTYDFPNLKNPRELSVTGKAAGDTVLNLWFPDPKDPKKDVILSYLVRVRPVPGSREDPRTRLERIYKAIECQINKAFPDSVVHLTLVGGRLVVSGQAKDRPEANAILQLVQGNAPGQRQQIPAGAVNLNVALTGADLLADAAEPGALQRLLQARAPSVVNLLHVPGEHQVMLRVIVAEVNRTAARSIGVNFSISNRQGLTVFSQLTGNLGGTTTNGSSGTGQSSANSGAGTTAVNLPMVLGNGQLRVAINALRNLDFARSVAEQTLVAMHGQTASFQAGGQFPVPVTTGITLSGLQGVSFIPFGVQLSFTPSISDKDRIRLSLTGNVSTRNISTGATISGTTVPGLNTRNFTTTVEMREGQTLALAGLIQNDFGADASRVPFFGDLPLVGRLFAADRTSAGEQELIVLVTPELVHPLEPKECPPLPGADLYEPGDIEFYLLGRLESRRPYDYRSPVMDDLARMIRYRHCEQIFIFGPQGHSDCKP